MRVIMKKIQSILNRRLGFMSLLILCLWLKSVIAYFAGFSLTANNPWQYLFLIVNPFATTVFFMSLALYFNRPKLSYIFMGIIYLIDTIFIYSNILFYRENADFIASSTITGVAKVAKGLGKTTASAMQLGDIIYWFDIIVIVLLFATHFIKIDQTPFRKINALATTFLGFTLFTADLAGSELNRPQLLGRTFDHSYIVKYLGINSFLAYDSVRSVQNSQVRSTATETEVDSALDYTKDNYAAPNPNYFGKANGKNIIIIHLESFEQFLIGMKINGQEVTPFLNSLYNDKNTISYDNFFNEVGGGGRTSDAETMLESGLFGFSSGSFFQKLGGDNTFQAAPAILQQEKGYTSAVFHGNVGSFWGRNVTYKNMGYNYFFDESYYDSKNPDTQSGSGYGIKDKLLFSEGAKYLEQLQQPFYTKFLTVTNHVDYQLSDEDNGDFKTSETTNDKLNSYFKTAHYLDKSVEEFFNYLNDSGLEKNTMVVLYGDHFGLNDDQHKVLSSLIGKNPDTWGKFDNTQMQRVPFMIHMNGLKGGIKHTYGGEIDVLPTILHLAGINTKQYVQLGTDLLSKDHSQLVALRNGNFITPHYTVLRSSDSAQVFSNDTGEKIDLQSNPELLTKVDKWEKAVDLKLSTSDSINNKNLLRFYTPFDFTPVNPADYSYQNQIQQMEEIRNKLGDKSTSLYSKNGNKSTTDLYNTDAVQLQDDRTPIDSWSYLNKK